jgi:hypothetical protein
MAHRPALRLFVLLLVSFCVRGVNASQCAPPLGFHDGPHPVIAAPDQLVSHTEVIDISRPFRIVSDAMNKPLEKTINKSESLPGVSGDYMLTQGDFGSPGSRHIVCLTDGTSTEEEALQHEDAPASSHFRYIVWNYTTPKAKPILDTLALPGPIHSNSKRTNFQANLAPSDDGSSASVSLRASMRQ